MKTLIKKLGTFISSRRTLNFIEGTNVTMTVTDNASTNAVDITINSSGGGGGSGWNGFTVLSQAEERFFSEMLNMFS